MTTSDFADIYRVKIEMELPKTKRHPVNKYLNSKDEVRITREETHQ